MAVADPERDSGAENKSNGSQAWPCTDDEGQGSKNLSRNQDRCNHGRVGQPFSPKLRCKGRYGKRPGKRGRKEQSRDEQSSKKQGNILTPG